MYTISHIHTHFKSKLTFDYVSLCHTLIDQSPIYTVARVYTHAYWFNSRPQQIGMWQSAWRSRGYQIKLGHKWIRIYTTIRWLLALKFPCFQQTMVFLIQHAQRGTVTDNASHSTHADDTLQRMHTLIPNLRITVQTL